MGGRSQPPRIARRSTLLRPAGRRRDPVQPLRRRAEGAAARPAHHDDGRAAVRGSRGGYTRVVKLGKHRLGDGTDLVSSQLVGREDGPQVGGGIADGVARPTTGPRSPRSWPPPAVAPPPKRLPRRRRPPTPRSRKPPLRKSTRRPRTPDPRPGRSPETQRPFHEPRPFRSGLVSCSPRAFPVIPSPSSKYTASMLAQLDELETTGLADLAAAADADAARSVADRATSGRRAACEAMMPA